MEDVVDEEGTSPYPGDAESDDSSNVTPTAPTYNISHTAPTYNISHTAPTYNISHTAPTYNISHTAPTYDNIIPTYDNITPTDSPKSNSGGGSPVHNDNAGSSQKNVNGTTIYSFSILDLVFPNYRQSNISEKESVAENADSVDKSESTHLSSETPSFITPSSTDPISRVYSKENSSFLLKTNCIHKSGGCKPIHKALSRRFRQRDKKFAKKIAKQETWRSEIVPSCKEKKVGSDQQGIAKLRITKIQEKVNEDSEKSKEHRKSSKQKHKAHSNKSNLQQKSDDTLRSSDAENSIKELQKHDISESTKFEDPKTNVPLEDKLIESSTSEQTETCDIISIKIHEESDSTVCANPCLEEDTIHSAKSKQSETVEDEDEENQNPLKMRFKKLSSELVEFYALLIAENEIPRNELPSEKTSVATDPNIFVLSDKSQQKEPESTEIKMKEANEHQDDTSKEKYQEKSINEVNTSRASQKDVSNEKGHEKSLNEIPIRYQKRKRQALISKIWKRFLYPSVESFLTADNQNETAEQNSIFESEAIENPPMLSEPNVFLYATNENFLTDGDGDVNKSIDPNSKVLESSLIENPPMLSEPDILLYPTKENFLSCGDENKSTEPNPNVLESSLIENPPMLSEPDIERNFHSCSSVGATQSSNMLAESLKFDEYDPCKLFLYPTNESFVTGGNENESTEQNSNVLQSKEVENSPSLSKQGIKRKIAGFNSVDESRSTNFWTENSKTVEYESGETDANRNFKKNRTSPVMESSHLITYQNDKNLESVHNVGNRKHYSWKNALNPTKISMTDSVDGKVYSTEAFLSRNTGRPSSLPEKVIKDKSTNIQEQHLTYMQYLMSIINQQTTELKLKGTAVSLWSFLTADVITPPVGRMSLED